MYCIMDIEQKCITNKRGYLSNDFIFFHLQDKTELQIESHFHDFNKVIVFLSGQVTYYIEGIAYKLQPWDILLISHDMIHKPCIDGGAPYRRMVLWLKPSFLAQQSSPSTNLHTCFDLASRHKFSLLRMKPETKLMIQTLLSQIHAANENRSFGDDLLQGSLCLQFIIQLNRLALEINNGAIPADLGLEYDETINKVLRYIDDHISEDLSIEKLETVFFLNKYYLMHKFKCHTGYSIHQYILQKRLITANKLIRSGRSIVTACLESGFRDYSSFSRVFKKVYGTSPRKYNTGQASAPFYD